MANAENKDALLAAAETVFTEPFGAMIKLLPDEGEAVWVDGRKAPPAISTKAPANGEADCAFRAAPDILLRVLSGERALESAYVSGRLAISGDMSVMSRLNLTQAK